MTYTYTIHCELTDLNTYIDYERSKNGRYQAAKIKKDMTAICTKYAKASGIQIRGKRVRITFKWYCPDKRKDPDNIAFAKKFIEDGMVNAGVLQGDGWNQIVSLQDEFYIDKDPRCEVELTEVQPC